MPSNPLESARAKLDRANYHLEQLKTELGRDGAYGFRLNFEPNTYGGRDLVVRALIPHALFVRISVVAGEVIHHARSALEHAVWEMVPAPDRVTGFPVFTVESDYDRKGVVMIQGINPAANAIIRGLQPFGRDYSNQLYILHKLWITDKHKLLNTCIAYPQGMSLIYTFPDGGFDASNHVSVSPDVEDGAELFRDSNAPMNVLGEGAMTFVEFDDGLVKGQPVAEVLTRLFQFANDVVDRLAKTI
jgi:hypothetical protein